MTSREKKKEKNPVPMPLLGARALPQSGHIRAPIDPTALRDRPVVAQGGSNPARQS